MSFIKPRLLDGNHKNDVEEQYVNFADFCCRHNLHLDPVSLQTVHSACLLVSEAPVCHPVSTLYCTKSRLKATRR